MDGTKDVQISWNGNAEIVKIKKLTFGERNDLMEEATEIKIIAGQTSARIRTGRMRELAILKCVVKAPFDIGIAAIRDLPVDVGDKLYEEIEELNAVTEAKKES